MAAPDLFVPPFSAPSSSASPLSSSSTHPLLATLSTARPPGCQVQHPLPTRRASSARGMLRRRRLLQVGRVACDPLHRPRVHLTRPGLGPSNNKINSSISLQRFYLSNNRISGEIPSSIGQLVNATDFVLDNNRLSGKIPTAIGRMSSLMVLDLSSNNLAKIPTAIGRMSSLMVLDLSSNNLAGPIPVQISQLTGLQYLHLSFNPALNLRSPPSFLGKINSLFQLGLADTGIVGVLPRWLASTAISTLDLSSNKLVGKMPAWIGNMTNLSNLNLSNNALESAVPEEFVNLTLLLAVDLHANKFTGPRRPAIR
ncbi:uncharacterized protein A4U43_C08F880 [Asparagus officinalis]|nr:uncharacterized protein A4U43_C08F880 [Asparagus officinalis]